MKCHPRTDEPAGHRPSARLLEVEVTDSGLPAGANPKSNLMIDFVFPF